MSKIKWDDKVYEVDYSEIDSDSALEIESKLGLGIIDLMVGLERGSVKALTAIYWYMKTSNGEEINIEDCKFKPMLFLAAMNEGAQEELDEQERAAKAAEEARLSKQISSARKKAKTLEVDSDSL